MLWIADRMVIALAVLSVAALFGMTAAMIVLERWIGTPNKNEKSDLVALRVMLMIMLMIAAWAVMSALFPLR